MFKHTTVLNARSVQFHLGPFWLSITRWFDDDIDDLVKLEIEPIGMLSFSIHHLGRI